jgi:hypothetical protein
MKTMIAIGCSWTWGHGIESDKTYSAHLQNYLNGWQVINAGHCGVDIDYAIFSAVNLIENQSIDFVVFQLSTLDRITLGTDGFDNFLGSKYYNDKDESIYYEDVECEYKRLIGINDNIKTKFTDGSYIGSIDENKFNEDEFNSSGLKNTSLNEYKTFVKVLTENISYSTYRFQKNFLNLLIFDSYLRNKNIKSLYFSYLPFPEDIYQSKYFIRFRESTNLINESWKTWLHKKYPDHDYYIDRSHINSNGNKVLAEEYLMPYIEKIL